MKHIFLTLKKIHICPFSMICELHHALYTTSNCSHLSSYIVVTYGGSQLFVLDHLKTNNVQSYTKDVSIKTCNVHCGNYLNRFLQISVATKLMSENWSCLDTSSSQ